MPVTKRIVCLANSRKLSGRCIAGREFDGNHAGAWIRPISAREHEEVSEYERQYENGSDPRVMDLIDVPLLTPRPKGYQQENWLLDPESYWVRTAQIQWADLGMLTDNPATLWVNGSSTYHGFNDQIPLAAAAGLSNSLFLIHVNHVELQVYRPGADFGNPKQRVQARFAYNGNNYWLRVTDPVIERGFTQRGDGSYQLGESYLTISLGEPFNNNCYKLVAAIIFR